MGHNKFLRGVATVFVDVFRGIPLIVLAFFIYFGIPQALGFTMPLFLAAILTLSLNAGAYVTEIIRGEFNRLIVDRWKLPVHWACLIVKR